MSIVKAIEKFYREKEKKGWTIGYWCIDVHGTIIKPNYQYGNIPTDFYPYAKEVLQILSKMDDICLILYTCSHPSEQNEYLKFFKENNINFKYVNKNPEVTTDNGGYGYYEEKPYFNVLCDDKAGFFPDEDWYNILMFFKTKYKSL